MSIPEKFENVTAVCKANVYFDGRVVSHTIFTAEGERRTLGVILPGAYAFTTGAPERMDVIAGTWRVRLSGTDWATYGPGQSFAVPGDAAFDVEIADGVAEYVCSYG
ncbi:MAG: pyrimidine/purine nucleoside phosphorylase [Desulfovibrionaceae bacterium]|jgi:uncharacterized protein YaiE (UPF0345 family)|nr:pyrimidine/purine nucleoside phosphorylase [Desulfovibrionaceae bacterium]